MHKKIKIIAAVISIVMLAACGEEWSCQTKGKTMFSMSSTGGIGSADKGCSGNEIRSFELKEFGRVDEAALKSDFGC